MSDEKIDDIDRPIELKQSKIASAIGRVGVSGKGLQIGALVGVVVVGAIGFGIMQAGPRGSNSSAESAGVTTDMPGQNQPFSIAKAVAEADAKRAAEAEARPQHIEGGGLQVRGAEQQPVAAAAGPSAQQLQTPAEQHRLWLEKKRYERIEGRILAADMALASDMTKGTPGGGGRLGGEGDADPLARLAGVRSAALNSVQQPPGQTAPVIPPGLLGAMANANPASLQLGGDPNVAAQERNREFLKEAAESGYLAESVKKRLGGHELAAGSIIPAVMLTGINSDLPGVITAQVRQTVYDTFDESVRVIPQGARLVGRYSSQIASGQERVLVAWDEMIFPNGNRINLRGMAGVDGQGQAGFNDKVNNHFFKTWGSALMVSLLGVGVQLSQPQNASYSAAPTAASQSAAAAANSLNEAGSKVLEKNLNISPSLQIRPGYVFNVIVNKSIMLPPYRD
jgi:type IV secretion system protein VirB10